MEDGSVCGSTFQVEFDHLRPRALGGPSTIENVRLACKPHNGLAARRVFGDAWMDRFTRPATRTAAAARAGFGHGRDSNM
jgi:5-methylcytosine-specific restriction endonuclease McrA